MKKFRIVKKEILAPGIYSFFIEGREIAIAARPGQFVIVRVREGGERFPLTLVSFDPGSGLIQLVSQSVGKSTQLLASLRENDIIEDIAGPLGNPSHMEKFGRVAIIGGGVGIAPLLPIARGLKEEGNEIVTILGARSGDLLFFVEEFREISSTMETVTDDGSSGKKGVVTDVLRKLLEGEKRVDQVMAIGPVPMMEAVSRLTAGADIPTVVSLNSIMIDGTGMCGGCRCSVKGKSHFACIHGPEFNGHEVDFAGLARRQRMFLEEEKTARGEFEKGGI